MKVKIFAVIGLCTSMISSSFATGADMSSMLTAGAGMMKTMQSMQQQETKAKEDIAKNDAELGKVQSTVNQANPNASPYANMPQGVVPGQKPGYPVLDPYANPQYWQQRGHQFKFSMDVAAKRAQVQNDTAKKMLEMEKQKTAKMLEGMGGLLKTAGSQMESIGAKRAEAQKTADAKKKDEMLKQCGQTPDKCTTGDNGVVMLDGKPIPGATDADRTTAINAGATQQAASLNLDKTRTELDAKTFTVSDSDIVTSDDGKFRVCPGGADNCAADAQYFSSKDEAVRHFASSRHDGNEYVRFNSGGHDMMMDTSGQAHTYDSVLTSLNSGSISTAQRDQGTAVGQ